MGEWGTDPGWVSSARDLGEDQDLGMWKTATAELLQGESSLTRFAKQIREARSWKPEGNRRCGRD